MLFLGSDYIPWLIYIWQGFILPSVAAFFPRQGESYAYKPYMPISACRRGFFLSPSALQISFHASQAYPLGLFIYPYTESTELFIEDQVFSLSYDLAPRPPPTSPIFCQQVVSLSRSFCVSPVELTVRRGGRVWGRSQITWKPGPLLIVQYSLLKHSVYNDICVAYVATFLQYILNQYMPFRYL